MFPTETSSILVTEPTKPVNKQPILMQLQAQYGSSGRGVKFGLVSASPLTDLNSSKTIRQVVEAGTLQQSIHSTEQLTLRPHNVNNFRMTSNNSSMISKEGAITSSCNTTTSGDKFKNFPLMQRSKEPDNAANHLKIYGQKKLPKNIAISIKRYDKNPLPLLSESQEQSFIPQPGRLATRLTQLTQATFAEGSNVTSTVSNAYFVNNNNNQTQNTPHGGSLASSMQFDKIRYQNLSKLNNSDEEESNKAVPNKSQLSTHEVDLRAHSQQPQYFNFNNANGDRKISREKNKMAQTTVISRKNTAYETHKSVSPTTAAMKTSTDFKCRYKELTWNQRPPGMVPLQANVGLNLNSKRNKRQVSKRSTESKTMNQQQIMGQLSYGDQNTLQPKHHNHKTRNKMQNKTSDCQSMTNRSSVDPYSRKKTPIMMQSLTSPASPVQFQFPTIKGGTTVLQISAANSLVKRNLMGASQEQIQNPTTIQMQNKLSTRSQRQTLLRDGNSQELPSNSQRKHTFINRQSYVGSTCTNTTQTQTISHQNERYDANANANTNLQKQRKNERANKMSKLEIESEMNNPERTFEVLVGGSTDASIFYDNTHARHEEEKEFDRLFGQREGRKFRIGDSVIVQQNRTMDEVRQEINPQLRDMLKRQYTGQQHRQSTATLASTAILSKTAEKSVRKSNNLRPSKHHSNLPTRDDKSEMRSSKHFKTFDHQPKTTHQQLQQKQLNPILIEHSSGINASSDSRHYLLDSAISTPKTVINKSIENHEIVTFDEAEAFQKFKQLGGNFFRQTERQIITMDNYGGLHYEQKNQFNNTMQTQQLRTPPEEKVFDTNQKWEAHQDEKWEEYKHDVIKVVQKGILSNKPKPKKVIPPPEPEPEINRILHLEVRTLTELMRNFSEQEQNDFMQELISFSVHPEPTCYLIQKIDILRAKPENDLYSLHLRQLYTFLFQKRTQRAFDKSRKNRLNPADMKPHFERHMRKVYDSVIAQLRSQIMETKIKQAENRLGTEDADLILNDASQTMSLTRMKEKKISTQKRTKEGKERRILDYIKYLIGQQGNKDFTLQREEFRQTHELHTKSLALSFDEYAAKEDNTMKTVANDILEKIEMNVIIQENTMPIAALKYADDPKFQYFIKMKEQMSLALPLLSKVVNKQLSLHNYTLGLEHCIAFSETCKFNKDFMSKLVLNNNGMTDDSLSQLLTGLNCMDTISVIDLRKNSVGEKSVRLMSDFFVRGFPRHLQVLRLVDCKMDHPSTYMLLRMLKQKSNLRTLALVDASFDERNEKELVQYLKHNSSLKELDLSWNQMSQQAYVKILQCIVKNNNLLMLNLSHNVLIHDPKSFQTKQTEEAKAISKDKMAKFNRQTKLDIKENTRIKQQARPISQSNRGSSMGSYLQQKKRKTITIQSANSSTSIVRPISSKADTERKQNSAKRESHLDFSQNRDDSNDSNVSYRSESKHAYREVINEKKALQVLKAKKYVTSSSELNQMITVLLTEVMKKNRKLQHLDLSNTNLPSHVIIHLCERLRKSRSILSVHFSNNPGLYEPKLEQTVHQLLKCMEQGGPIRKINVNSTIDYALNTNMVERLQQSLKNEAGNEDDKFLARDTIKIRQIMQQKRIDQKAIDFPKDPESKQLILSRMIGFKEQMPGTGQWKLGSDTQDQCWHCDQHIYSLIFWDADTIGRQAKKNTHHKVLNQMVKLVEQMNPEINDNASFISLSIYDEDATDSSDEVLSSEICSIKSIKELKPALIKESKNPFQAKQSPPEKSEDQNEDSDNEDNPILFGSFTNWMAKPMMKLENFVSILDNKYGGQTQDRHEDFQGILNIMRNSLRARRQTSRFMSQTSFREDNNNLLVESPNENISKYEDLNPLQRKYYDKLVKKRQSSFLSDWKGVIEQYLEYRKPFLIDAYQLNSEKYSKQCPDLYVLPVFMPAGKHTYMVKNMETFEYTMHSTICDFRTEDPPVLIKDLRNKNVHRAFTKENSVFKDWKEDTELELQLACESDIQNSKYVKLIKDPFQLTAIYDRIFDQYKDLKLLHMQQACNSNYPFVTSNDFMNNFAEKYHLFSNNKEKSLIDVAFAASCSKSAKGQHKTGLNRAEFIEILIRIAIQRYVQTGIVNKPVLAFNKLMKEDIIPNWQMNPLWQEFRSRYLWTLDVNDVFAANIFGLHKLHERYQTIHKNYLEIGEANYIFTQEAPLVTEFIFKVCYGFSKMTVQDDYTNSATYSRLEFVEFLECIGRIAVAYWLNNREHLQEIQLAKKIEFVLDQLLPIVNIKRNEVSINEESESCTDEDY